MNKIDSEDRKALLIERKEAREYINAFGPLIASGGWRKLNELVTKHIKQREQQALYGDLEGTARERVIGEAAGLRLAMNFPELVIETARDVKDSEIEGLEE